MQHQPNKYNKTVCLSISNRTVSGFTISKIKTLLIGVFFLFASAVALSQNDSINKQNDSINTSLIQAFNKKLSIIEAQRLTDSIKKVALEKQLLSLKTTDNLKKEDLENYILFSY